MKELKGDQSNPGSFFQPFGLSGFTKTSIGLRFVQACPNKNKNPLELKLYLNLAMGKKSLHNAILLHQETMGDGAWGDGA